MFSTVESVDKEKYMTKINQDIWAKILDEIERDVGSNFNFWFKNISYEVMGDTFVIKLPNKFYVDHFGKRYDSIIRGAIEKIALHKYDVNYIIDVDGNKNIGVYDEDEEDKSNNLINRYTFDNFVVGKSNEFPHAAAISVAESPGNLYNPLFIYGSSGLGKTHLMHAIGNYLMDENPDLNTMYVSSEQFTNELVEAIRRDTTPEFRNKYRNVDLLLVDDIQFLTGKEGIQEEFFHTFNVLYQNEKQIVVTSDKPPKDLKGLETRIITRLGGGLIADIMSPDIETRIAILRNKNEQEAFGVSEKIIDYIAENVDSNIRELEGALLRIVAYSNLTSKEIDLNMAQLVLRDVLEQKKKIIIDSLRIKTVVSKEYGISVEDMESKKRPKDIAYPRQIAMFLCRELTELSLPKIGLYFGGRDHTTVIHAIDKIANEIKENSETKKTINDLKRKIKDE